MKSGAINGWSEKRRRIWKTAVIGGASVRRLSSAHDWEWRFEFSGFVAEGRDLGWKWMAFTPGFL